MKSVAEQINDIHREHEPKHPMIVPQGDFLEGKMETSEVPKEGDKININVEENVKNGTCCPRCQSYLCVPRKVFEPTLKSELQKVCVGLCASCGYNPYGKPYKIGIKTPERNDPCKCGSGKKYKHCCLLLTKHLGRRVADAVISKVKKGTVTK